MEVRQTIAMFRIVVAAGILLVAYGTAAAQAQGDAQRARLDAERIRARQSISRTEVILGQAITAGAEMVLVQVRNVMPADRPRLSGAPRVTGVRLENYGVMFFVQVPDLILPIMWDMRHLVQDTQLRQTEMTIQQLRTAATSLPEGPGRDDLLQRAGELEQQIALGNMRPSAGGRLVGAASVVPVPLQPGAPKADPQVPAPRQPETPKVDPQVVDDPESAYTREIKSALIDAMLDHSQSLSIGPDETLTIAARDSGPNNPMFPGDSLDSSTWVLSVKGSVLAAYQARTMTKEEARQQVQVREQ